MVVVVVVLLVVVLLVLMALLLLLLVLKLVLLLVVNKLNDGEGGRFDLGVFGVRFVAVISNSPAFSIIMDNARAHPSS